MTDTQAQPISPRPLFALAFLIFFPLLVAVILSPAVFNGLQHIGEQTEALTKITDARFERVASRIAMLTAALLLVPVLRMTGLIPVIRKGLTPSPARWKELRVGLAFGTVSIAALYGLGWGLGAYGLTLEPPGPGRAILLAVEIIAGALFIGVFEELFFRGVVFGALRTRLTLPVAALASSLFFSAIHFFRPRFAEEIDRASWHAGLDLFPVLFFRFRWDHDWAFMITLFLMGMTLALLYEKRKNLFLIAGLHAGWVLAMRTGSEILTRQQGEFSFWFGSSALISKAPLAIAVILWFLIAAWLTKPREDVPPGS